MRVVTRKAGRSTTLRISCPDLAIEMCRHPSRLTIHIDYITLRYFFHRRPEWSNQRRTRKAGHIAPALLSSCLFSVAAPAFSRWCKMYPERPRKLAENYRLRNHRSPRGGLGLTDRVERCSTPANRGYASCEQRPREAWQEEMEAVLPEVACIGTTLTIPNLPLPSRASYPSWITGNSEVKRKTTDRS